MKAHPSLPFPACSDFAALLARANNRQGKYSGSRFQPVSIDTRLLHPCRITIIRCPKTNRSKAQSPQKCHTRAQWTPPITEAKKENCTGLKRTIPVRTDRRPSKIAKL